MLPIISFVIALMAFALAAALAMLGRRYAQQARQRLENIGESVRILRVSQESLERKWSETQLRQAGNDAALEAQRSGLEELQARFEDVESYAAVCVPQKPASSGLNINRRVEAVRLLREGQSEEQVAAELALALSEVRLIGHLEKNAPKPAPKRGRRVA
ncbi:MAG: hypothetical protein IT169_08125 [Bryobacterales bacterium]|nr:hypothetical protein [Bryobacterales bacterium]